MPCPFCDLHTQDILHSSTHLVAFRDRYPISPGHTLIVPRSHVASYFDLSEDEKSQILTLLEVVKAGVEEVFTPSGYNVGWNEGSVAGQTVFHFHLHVIPRYEGDVEDPRGGVRWVIPEKANYWENPEEAP